jgi:plasmid stabilization system protein ParE
LSAEGERRIWFLEDASEDIVTAFQWYELRHEGLGARFVEAVDSALVPVLAFPDSCEAFERDTRRCLVEHFPFEIFYRVDGNLVVVVACMHATRDPEAVLRRVGG